MKIKLEEKNAQLLDSESKYYCGSSCLLSLWILLQGITATSDRKFEAAFARLNENLLVLFDDDTLLFDLSKTDEILTYEQWHDVVHAFTCYQEIISDLVELQDYCFAIRKRQYLPCLEHHKEFLCDLAMQNLKVFDAKENKPSFYERVSFEIFKTIQKENRYETFR